jgi:hypothetical protein
MDCTAVEVETEGSRCNSDERSKDDVLRAAPECLTRTVRGFERG